MRTLRTPIRLGGRRAGLGLLLLALALSAIAWYFGVNVWHAVLLGCAATVIGVVTLGVSNDDTIRRLDWRAEARERPGGSRDDVLNLSWSLRAGWGRAGRTAEIRLRQTAARRLALEGLDLADPEDQAAIQARLGARAYTLLTRKQITGMALDTLIACLDLLDELDPRFYPPTPPRARRWWQNLNPLRLKEAK